MYRAVFLDRDNTIIHAGGGDVGDARAVQLIQGAASAIASLRGLGYKIVVISNQGGVARGVYTEADVEAVHKRISELVRGQSGAVIDRFYYCPYHPEGTVVRYRREHPWRKPGCGMIQQAAKDLNLDPRQCWTVGDHVRDVQAGKAAGTSTILLGSDPIGPASDARPDFTARNLIEAARIIAQQPRPERESPGDGDALGPRTQGPAARTSSIAPASPATIPSIQNIDPTTVEWEIDDARTEPVGDEASGELDAMADTPAPPARAENRSAGPAVPRPPREVARGGDSGGPTSTGADPSLPGDATLEAQETGTSVELLSQILRELKRQRVDSADFSWMHAVAVMIQMVTAGCAIVAAFYFGDIAFLEWMLLAVLGQLAVIAALLARR